MPRGIYLTLTNCEPDRHDEFNHWYSNVHLPHVLDADGLVRGRRYANARPEMGPSHYLGLYEIEGDDLLAVVEGVRRKARARLEEVGRPGFFGPSVAQYVFSLIDPSEVALPSPGGRYPSIPGDGGGARPAPGQAAPPAKTKSGAVYMVMSNCGDPSREDEFDSWYSHVHVPDMAAARGIVAGSRWRNVEPQKGPSNYAALYEFADGDLEAAMADFQRLGTMTMEGRIIDCMQSVGMWWWWEIDATAYA